MTKRTRPTIGEAEPRPEHRGKTLRDYAEALKPPAADPYTHEVLNRLGDPFALKKSEEAAIDLAEKIGGTVRPFTPNPAHTGLGPMGARYDH